MTEIKPGISGIKYSDTVIELKASTIDGSSCSTGQIDQNNDESPKGLSEDERKTKPPAIDLSAAQELLQGIDGGPPKTPISAPPITSGEMLDRRKYKERKIGHRRVNEEGLITFKKIGTSQIMQSIQLGIGYAIGSLASKPERDILMIDFTIVETTAFPPEGSNVTPAHHFSEFRFKTYAPLAFRYFRDLFGIQRDDFLLSLCHNPLRELSNPGASGSIFYRTDDDEFIIKTIQHKESEFLQKLLAGYYMNLNQNPRTLLPKFFGLYCYQCSGKNIRMVVMNNLLPSYIKLHEKYDLKGSTYKRKAGKSERKKESPTYKDLDFIERHPEGILLEPDTYNALIKTMQRDCRVLESFKIMDYSFLVGIHNVDLARKENMEQARKDEDCNASPMRIMSEKSKTRSLVRSKSINKQRLAAFSTAMESIQAEVEMVDENDEVLPGGIPAKNSKGESLLLFVGIIDILQSFRLAKKLEHAFKSVLHDGDTVSVHRPCFYSQRFQQFMSKTVFKKMPTAFKQSSTRRKVVVTKKSSVTDPKFFLPKIPSKSTDEDSDIMPTSSTFSAENMSGLSEMNSTVSNEKQSADKIPSKVATKSSSVSKTSVLWDKTDVISLSHVVFQTESEDVTEIQTYSTQGVESTLHRVICTPPHSLEGSTPTFTEGTPSFTESSSSGDVAFPTTPVKSINKSLDYLPPLRETQIL